MNLGYLPILEITLLNSLPPFISFNQTQVPYIKQNFDFWALACRVMKLNQQNGQASEISILKENIPDLTCTCKDWLLPQ